jgi:hypothetical protein
MVLWLSRLPLSRFLYRGREAMYDLNSVKLQTELEISSRGANEWGIHKDPHGKVPQTIHPATESGHFARTPRRTRAGFRSVRQAPAASDGVLPVAESLL